MLRYLKNFVNRIKYPNKYNSKAFTKYCKQKGCKIGKGTYFFSPTTTYVDTKNAILLLLVNIVK